MQFTKSLLIGMAALPWASAFGTMPKKKKPTLDDLPSDRVDTVGQSAGDNTAPPVDGNQVYIQIKGGEGSTGEAECNAWPSKQGTSGCYRIIESYVTCKLAADWFSSEYGKDYDNDDPVFDPPRGSITDISDKPNQENLPGDCYQTNRGDVPPFKTDQPEPGQNQFYFNLGGSPGWGDFDTDRARNKLRYVCEYFCPPADDPTCEGTGTCYAAGIREKSPQCGTHSGNSTACLGVGCTWIC